MLASSMLRCLRVTARHPARPVLSLFACAMLAACGGGGDSTGTAASVTATTATATPATTATTPSDALPTDALFAATSFWYQTIPAGATLNANSAAYAAEFVRQKNAYYGDVGLNTASYASPVFDAAAGSATIAVAQWDCQNKGTTDTGLTSQWAAVPMPAVAVASDGDDMEMTVYQAATDSMWEFWQARQVGGQWQACWGGQMTHVSTSDGIWPAYYGTTATGLPFMGGQITAEELQRGSIRHVIGIALVDAEQAGIVSWPAARSDGVNADGAANRIPEGTRLRLDPSIDLDTLNLHPVAKIIAKAAQTYGFVVWDKAGSLSLRLENPKSYTALGQVNPYTALFNGTASYAIMDNFPWDKLQFMPLNYGKP